MRRRVWIIGGLLLAGFGLATGAYFSLRDSMTATRQQSRLAPPNIKPLADQLDLIGEWNRVEFSEAVIPVNWRTFSATGKFQVCYGDVIKWGTFRFVDGSTLETIEGHDGELNRWIVGRADGKLVLVHSKNGWVEQYVSVPVGTLQP
jgi:hypothetical protein